jgi:endonuclease-8
MPEGDVVWRTAARLDAALAGRRLASADLRWPSVATTDLSGRTVIDSVARGKHLLLRLDGDVPLTLHSHLRMEGSWHLHATGELWRARPADGIRAVLVTDAWTAVGHRLGMLDLVPTREEGALVGHLGPDVLGPDWDPERVLAALRRDPRRPIGEALLDQRVLAGIGTFYLAETMYLSGRTPWTTVEELDADGRLTRIVQLARRLLLQGRDRAGQVTTGDARPGREAYVHGRSGLPCRRCGGAVRVAPIGHAPQERVAFYCPGCQQGPAPTDDGRSQRPLGSRTAR